MEKNDEFLDKLGVRGGKEGGRKKGREGKERKERGEGRWRQRSRERRGGGRAGESGCSGVCRAGGSEAMLRRPPLCRS